jgi:hypothetical protein
VYKTSKNRYFGRFRLKDIPEVAVKRHTGIGGNKKHGCHADFSVLLKTSEAFFNDESGPESE